MKLLKRLLAFYFILIFVLGSYGQETKKLFTSDNILQLKIEFHMNDLIKDVEVRDYHDAILSMMNEDTVLHEFKVKLKVRGNNRANKKTCKFPPLEVNFGKKSVKNSVFENQNKLKLVTHCRNSKDFYDYVTKEYMTYKLYQLVTPVSFNVRLCEITYVDLDNQNETSTQIGFFIEKIKDVAKRNDMVVNKDSIKHQDFCNKKELDKLTIFQFMIGNLDWSVPNRHNIKILSPEETGLPIAVPYDFDFAGIVSTPYAKPPDDMNIANVRTRVFRGLCRFDNGYGGTLDYFQTLKPKFIQLTRTSTYLSDKSKKSVDKYLESFYTILDNPKLLSQKVTTVCRAKHKHLYENN